MFQEVLDQLVALNTLQLIGLALGLFFGIELGQGLFASFYNVFLHPLRHYPGSIWDVAFPLYRSFNVIKGDATWNTVKRHEQYGEVVRTAANTLSYISPDAWKDIYGHANDMPKAIAAIGFTQDSIFIASKGEHGRQRRAMAPAFSDKSLAPQERLIRVHIDLLIQRLRETNAQPTNAVRWFNLVTFDIIGDLAFGHQLQGLEKNETNQWIDNIGKLIQFIPYIALIRFSKILGIILKVLFGPKMKAAKAKQDAYIKGLLQERLSKQDRGDFMDYLIGKLPEKELIANADLFMIAGSHTSSVLLSGVTYHLARNSDILAKAVKEVRESFEDGNQITFQSCGRLSYLQAVIEEGLRLFPPVPLAMDRKTIVSTKICGKMVPPGIMVGVPHLAAYHNETNFHKAKEFHPERWLEKNDMDSPFYNDRRDVFNPFSYGPRNCIGQSLAYHEIRLILSKILWNFDIELERENLHWNEQRIFAMWELPPLKVRYVSRFKDMKG